MYRAITLAVATPVSVADLLDAAQTRYQGIAFQAASANVSNINFGDSSQQPAFILPGGNSAVLPSGQLANIYIKGDVGDVVIVMVF